MKKLSKIQNERIKKATENLEEIKKILDQFPMPYKIINPSTQGQWQKESAFKVVIDYDEAKK